MALMGQTAVRVWGVRGSYPVIDKKYVFYGGNTSCFSVELGGGTVIFDAGSGIRALGKELKDSEAREAWLFLGHYHLDHIQGLPSFAPLGLKNFTLHIFGMTAPEEILDGAIGGRYWPLGVGSYPAKTVFHALEAGDGATLPCGARVRTMAAVHPGGGLLYRLDYEGKSLVYALDFEAGGVAESGRGRSDGMAESGENAAGDIADFASGADLLIWDGTYCGCGLKRGYGHSSFEQGLDAAGRAGVKRILMAHYSADYEDDFLRAQERKFSDGVCIFAREGMVITL